MVEGIMPDPTIQPIVCPRCEGMVGPVHFEVACLTTKQGRWVSAVMVWHYICLECHKPVDIIHKVELDKRVRRSRRTIDTDDSNGAYLG